MTQKIMTWDLGATKCAAALVLYEEQNHHLHCKQSSSIKIRSCTSLHELTNRIENTLEINMSDVDAICIGAAGQYDGECLQLAAGYPYPMNFAAFAKQKN